MRKIGRMEAEDYNIINILNIQNKESCFSNMFAWLMGTDGVISYRYIKGILLGAGSPLAEQMKEPDAETSNFGFFYKQV